MRILMLGSTPDRPGEHQFLTTYVVNDALAVDAGCLGLRSDPAEQAHVTDVLLTHSHMDHVATLPVFLESSRDARGRGIPVRVHGHPATLECLRADVFNDRLWPDLFRLAGKEGPHLVLNGLEPERTFEVAGLRVTPVLVNHTVPAYGYLVEDESGTVAFGGDSAPTDRIWQLARERDNLRAVFLEATFPDGMEEFALLTGHLTPSLFAREASKLPPEVAKVAVHIRPRFRSQVVAQLGALGLSALIVAVGGEELTF